MPAVGKESLVVQDPSDMKKPWGSVSLTPANTVSLYSYFLFREVKLAFHYGRDTNFHLKPN